MSKFDQSHLETEGLKHELAQLKNEAKRQHEEYEALVNKAYGMQPHFKGVDTKRDHLVDREAIASLKEGRSITESAAEEKKARYEATVAKIRELWEKLDIDPLDRKF
ncbi:MAG TPA: hypothetical protein VE973_00145 [Candidatus Limnocylindria bacterium]|nr:hypothetical protein [Candidatus Limnocylindria bacterium]